MNQKFLLIYLVVCVCSLQAYATDPTPPNFKFDHKFIVNKGQISGWENAPTDIKYYVQRGLMTVYFLEDRVSYVLRSPQDHEAVKSRIDLTFGSANPSTIYGIGKRKSKIKYYSLGCPEGLKVSDFEKVIYENVYEKIDLVYYFDQTGSLKYDFIVHPGGDPDDIRLNFNGNIGLEILDNGSMKVTSTAGEINEAAPYTYLEGSRQEVESGFEINEDESIGFNIGEYDPEDVLIIDPEVKWSTFYGGESFDNGIGSTTDANGNIYLTGQTYSLEFPNITKEYGNGERGDIVLGKFSASGAHQWTIYYGGDDESRGNGITFDESGNIYAVGFTESKFLPDPESPGTPQEASGNSDIVILKVNANGSPVRVRTYGSFNGQDKAEDIAYDNNGLYLTGLTSTSELEFPVTAGAHQVVKAGDVDAFLMRIDLDMNIIWSTYLGGNRGDEAYGITVDSDGDPYITGATSSTDLPFSSNPFSPGATDEETDVFVAKFNKADGTLNWLNYLGGNQKDFGDDIVAFSNDLIYVVGQTASTNLEIVGNDTLQVYQPTFGGGPFDGFIFQLDANTGTARWSSYFGGSGDDRAYAVTTTAGAEALIVGYTESQNFPTVNNDNAVRENFQGGEEDAFLSLFSDAGVLRYSGYVGGTQIDVGRDVSFHRPSESVYMIGRTRSADFPVSGDAYQPQYNGGGDIFIYTLGVDISEPTDPNDSIPSIFCDNVRNNVISTNPLWDDIFSGVCLEDVPLTAVLFYGTTPTILDGGDFSYLYQISSDNSIFQNIRDEDGNIAVGMNLTLADIDLDRYPPGLYYVRRLVITDACIDGSGSEVIDYEDFSFAFADFTFTANCSGESILLEDNSDISGESIATYTYTVIADGNTETFTGENVSIGPYAAGNIEVTLDITSDEGCMGSVTKTIEVREGPAASFDYANENDVVCLDFPYQFTNTSTSDAEDPIVSYQWDFGGGMTSEEENPVVTFENPGAKTITLTITTEGGCSDQFSTSFTSEEVLEAPTVDAGPDQEISKGRAIRLEPTVNIPDGQELSNQLWTSNPEGAFENYDPTLLVTGAQPSEDSYLSLLVTTDLGCKAQDSLQVIVDEFSDGDPDIPNLFTPNGDGFNDDFIIDFLEPFPEARVKIFNRWGSVVYNTTDYYSNPWDGTYEGEPAPTGVYYYIISFPDGRNEIEGTVTLLR